MQIKDYLDKILAVIAESPFIESQNLALDPKVKDLSTYPEHKHTSKELLPAGRPEFHELLKEISSLIEVDD